MNHHKNNYINNILEKYDSLFNRHKYEKGYQVLLKITHLNCSECFWRLGELFEYGYGVKKDLNKSIEYYQKAVELGDIRWYSDIGNNYRKLKNYTKAINFFKVGVQNKQILSLFFLGNFYEFGKGVSINKQRAIYYYSLGSSRGHILSKMRLARYFVKGEFGFFKRLCGYIWMFILVIQTIIISKINDCDERLSGFDEVV